MGECFKTGRALFSNGKLASEYSVGESVYLLENGSPVEYFVAHQGLPDSTLYDSSCNGTWLLRKDNYVDKAMNSSTDNRYARSEAHTYLNSTFLSIFDTAAQNTIKQVKIPYVSSYGYQRTVSSGSNGLSTKVFLLSSWETGLGPYFASSYMPVDGAKLELFKDVDDFGGGSEWLFASLNGVAANWWMRTPRGSNSDTSSFWYVTSSVGSCWASYGSSYQTESYRPALIIPSDVKFDSNTHVLKV